jgi:hypothetical protein
VVLNVCDTDLLSLVEMFGHDSSDDKQLYLRGPHRMHPLLPPEDRSTASFRNVEYISLVPTQGRIYHCSVVTGRLVT